MNTIITNGQTIGGSANILDRLSKDELIKIWHHADEKLRDINPMEDYESFAYYKALFDAVVKAYYKDSTGIVIEHDENGDIIFN